MGMNVVCSLWILSDRTDDQRKDTISGPGMSIPDERRVSRLLRTARSGKAVITTTPSGAESLRLEGRSPTGAVQDLFPV